MIEEFKEQNNQLVRMDCLHVLFTDVPDSSFEKHRNKQCLSSMEFDMREFKKDSAWWTGSWERRL